VSSLQLSCAASSLPIEADSCIELFPSEEGSAFAAEDSFGVPRGLYHINVITVRWCSMCNGVGEADDTRQISTNIASKFRELRDFSRNRCLSCLVKTKEDVKSYLIRSCVAAILHAALIPCSGNL
jgi:hypothetical protein